MCLDYSQATLFPHPAWFKEKSPFMKMVPGAKKVGDCCSRYFCFLNLHYYLRGKKMLLLSSIFNFFFCCCYCFNLYFLFYELPIHVLCLF